MNKKELSEYINRKSNEKIELLRKMRDLEKEFKDTLDAYAREHTPYAPGQKVELPEGTGFFAYAETVVNPGAEGHLRFLFYGMKKDGSMSKRINWNLTQWADAK